MMQGTAQNIISNDLARTTSDQNLLSERKIAEKRGSKQSKLKEKLKPTASQILNHSSPQTIKDCAKVIQKRRKEQEMVWKVKCDNSKKSFDNLFAILTTNIKEKKCEFNKKEIIESIK